MASPVLPQQFCDAIPANNANLCTRFSKLLNLPSLLCDFMSWLLDSTGNFSTAVQTALSNAIIPTGCIQMSATLNMGSGWLQCDGSEVSRSTYAALFAQIGTRYGSGDNSTTFNLPDFRSRSPMGAGSPVGLSTRDINTISVGEETHTQTIAELVPHTHTWNGPAGRVEERGTGANVLWFNSATDNTGSTGGGVPFNVVHPCFICFYFVKT